MFRIKTLAPAALVVLALALFGCGSPAASTPAAATSAPGTTAAANPGTGGKVTLVIGGYSTPQEALAKVIPLFQKYWKDKTGQDVDFQQSYQGSGAQSRAIIGGFEADIAILSQTPDVDAIVKAGLITSDYTKQPHNGIVTDSIAVIAVRKGNPKGIKDWNDLTAQGLQVLTPDPKTSGGAKWNVIAVWGAASRGNVPTVTQGDDSAYTFLKAVYTNVIAYDKDARTSLTNFEKGVGDAAITYENEVQLAKLEGEDNDYVIPRSTILIESPVAVVDKYADKHGTRAVAEAFRDYLWTKDAQTVFAQYGFRPLDPDVATATAAQFPAVKDLFTIKDVGGWSDVNLKFFSTDGLYNKALQEIQTK